MSISVPLQRSQEHVCRIKSAKNRMKSAFDEALTVDILLFVGVLIICGRRWNVLNEIEWTIAYLGIEIPSNHKIL